MMPPDPRIRVAEATQRDLVARAEREGRSLTVTETRAYETLQRIKNAAEASDRILKLREAQREGAALAQQRRQRWEQTRYPRPWPRGKGPQR